jgi:hypothetical protein
MRLTFRTSGADESMGAHWGVDNVTVSITQNGQLERQLVSANSLPALNREKWILGNSLFGI